MKIVLELNEEQSKQLNEVAEYELRSPENLVEYLVRDFLRRIYRQPIEDEGTLTTERV